MKLPLSLLLCLTFATAASPSTDCPVTIVEESDVDVPVFTAQNDQDCVWHGTHRLAVWIAGDGVFSTRCSGKMWWWRQGDWHQDKLHVTARRLDDPGIVGDSWWTSNATLGDGSRLMLNPIGFPTAGCWEVTASYYDDASLTFVTEVREPTEITYAVSSVSVGAATSRKNLLRRLAAGLRMRDYFGYTWEIPRDWQAFEEALEEVPLPRTLEVYGFDRLSQELPGEARMMAAVMEGAASRAGSTDIVYKESRSESQGRVDRDQPPCAAEVP